MCEKGGITALEAYIAIHDASAGVLQLPGEPQMFWECPEVM